ncbi:MmcQ/YjbR family DNA-binding protein [Echinimonas agarilytica]|uniref:MmcQ/YjbR family DNA-binding protein n=1 Tax=Echinimonas agarilytica TaxID=1215918 RepID=A0AA42B717_9GAMM|nr:MmcQ/YjbR family DNA-binding protein [Echinimonas agarilytica]MCM2679402.1 MmcQ/YjbR family DNA-binding protein [Echinimonas agarilytica]
MEFNALNEYLLEAPKSSLDFPFGKDVYVYKVKGKMFALLGHRGDMMTLNLKCNPDEAAALCDVFEGILPGYHMNKKHWITIYFDGSVPNNEVLRLIDNSYALVVSKLPKKDRISLELQTS